MTLVTNFSWSAAPQAGRASEGQTMRSRILKVSTSVVVVLGSLGLLDDERGLIQQTLERMVRERAGARGVAILTSPINIGIGTK